MSTCYIPLSQGFYAKVDEEDFDRVNQFKWCAQWLNNKDWYAMRTDRSSGKAVNVMLSRFITNAALGQVVDHRDHDTLNNCRQNLRVCTQSQNMMNRVQQINNSSGVKGIFWRERDHRWVVQCSLNGKRICKTFFDFDDAVKARLEFVQANYGEFAFAEGI